MKKGFTMLEVIVSIAITGIILALLTTIMNSANREYSMEKSRLYNSSTARAILLEIEDSIKEASFATCFFDNLGLSNASDDIKRLIYVKPLKPGTSPYMLVLKNKSTGGWELHRMYCDNNISSKIYVNGWKQQGTSMVHKAGFEFTELTAEEMSMLNSQVDSYMCSYMLSGLTKLLSPPVIGIEIEDMQNYYKKDDLKEYIAHTSSINEAGLVYLENLKFEYCTSMITTVDNLVMDGIDDIEITQIGRDSFDVLIRCGEEEYSSSVIMRSYARGVGLEKK